MNLNRDDRNAQAFSLVEVMVGLLVLSVMIVSLYAGFSSGFGIVKLSRENLRATQILVQKTEAVRILKWSQVTNSGYLAPTFVDYYNPAGTNDNTYGCLYQGFVSEAPPANIPADYQSNMLAITVTLFWTNNLLNAGTNVIVRSRQMQTYVARFGMQDYIYK